LCSTAHTIYSTTHNMLGLLLLFPIPGARRHANRPRVRRLRHHRNAQGGGGRPR
jgi:hypothetical protein